MSEIITKLNFSEKVEKSKLPVVIDFFADWCGPCRMMAPIFEELSKEYHGKIVFGKVNTEEQPEISGRFGIRSIPCLILFKNGKEAGRITGYQPKELLKKQIEQVLK